MKSRFDLSFVCPNCNHAWERHDSRVIMDDECPRCGVVSNPKDYVERKPAVIVGYFAVNKTASNGEFGCFLWLNDGCCIEKGELLSPVFKTSTALFDWLQENGWTVIQEHIVGCLDLRYSKAV